MIRRCIAAAFAVVASAAAPAAAWSQGYPLIPLVSSGTTIVGETVQYPTTGPAHITGAIVTLGPGERTITHQHGVPVFSYILEGELTVDYGAQGTRVYRQGQAFLEAMHVNHFGINTGTQPVRILAVYIGAKGSDDVIREK